MSAESHEAYMAALKEHAEAFDPETGCPHCMGDGKVANDDDGSPWHVWELMPDENAMARNLGLVFPIDCPLCGGSGKKTPPSVLASCEGCATSLVTGEGCEEHGLQYAEALRAFKAALDGQIEEAVEEAAAPIIAEHEATALGTPPAEGVGPKGIVVEEESTLVYDLSSWTPNPKGALVEHLVSALAGTEDRWLREMGDAVAVSYRDLARVVAEVIPFKAVGFLDPENAPLLLDGLGLRLEIAAGLGEDDPPTMVAIHDWPGRIEPVFTLEGIQVRPPIVDANVGTLLAEDLVEVELPDGQTVKVPASSVRPA